MFIHGLKLGVIGLEKEATEEYLNRKYRYRHPDGKFNNAQKWNPSEAEMQICCSRIRSPSRRFPYSYMHHCRTAKHVAHLYEVNQSEVKQIAKIVEQNWDELVIEADHRSEFMPSEECSRIEAGLALT